jgi:hypothetical protein
MGKFKTTKDGLRKPKGGPLNVTKYIFSKAIKWRPEPTLKNGAYSEKPYE